jgi:hypothetical protein
MPVLGRVRRQVPDNKKPTSGCRIRCIRQFTISLMIGLACILALPVKSSGGTRDVTGQPLYDIVGVGLSSSEILLATPIGNPGQYVWRFRKIVLSASSDRPRTAVLSSSGTKLLVGFAKRAPLVVDLTERITEIDGNALPPPQHRLPHQLFPLVSGETVCLSDDLGSLDPNKCSQAAAAAVRGDGRVLYAFNDGKLVVVAPDGSREELAYRLPVGSQWKLIAGYPGGQRDFLVVVTDRSTGATSGLGASMTRIIDPRRPEPRLAEYADPVVAELRASLELSRSAPIDGTLDTPVRVDDAALSTLAERLKQDSSKPKFSWSFYLVSPNQELYAPVLELAPGEPDFPSDVGIWNDIGPLAHGTTRQDYEKAYASLGNERWSRCASYVRTLSYPGTWLIEYWYYYPFDEGKPHAHIHDSEHMFIEVDKLGGAVRNVFASDHNGFVSNNLYSVLVKNAPPVTLPLYANVEFGKHAMAPDLNHDGSFTRGLDDNLHLEPYEVWGLRDIGKKRGDLMEPYRARMSLPRSPEDRFALADSSQLFPGFPTDSGHQVCQLIRLPDAAHCDDCAVASPEAATAHLIDHRDAQVPENIYKPYVVPWREVRFGVGIYDWSGGREQLSVALVGDFRHMTGGLLPLPARLGLEYAWTPFTEAVLVHLDGRYQIVHSRWTMYAGLRLERLVTNTQGFYFAFTPSWVDSTALSTEAVHWQYGGVSYHVGYVIELPSAHKGNFTNQVGVQIRNSPYFPVLFEWRVSFGFFRQRGRHDFGARSADRNPYE